MRDSDQPQFTELIQALAACFRVDPSPALYEGYWLGLRNLSVEDVSRAVSTAIGTGKRMPYPAELRELAGEAPVSMLAVQAWAVLRQSAARVGAYESVDFGPILNATIRAMGGWQRFCCEELNDFVRKDFERTFSAFATMGVGEEQGRHLVGLHEMSNRGGGFEVKPPVRIQGVPDIENKRALRERSPEITAMLSSILEPKP